MEILEQYRKRKFDLSAFGIERGDSRHAKVMGTGVCIVGSVEPDAAAENVNVRVTPPCGG